MNDNERILLNEVCSGDIRKAQQAARVILNSISSQKDQTFKSRLLKQLDTKNPQIIELPYNLRSLLDAQDPSTFPKNRFLLRSEEKTITERILAIKQAAAELEIMGIRYLPSAIFYGKSGTGKTMLARYIAYKADLPFVYVRFSGLVDSLLGKTSQNLNKVFEYARSAPCVLCLDELDAIGMSRGASHDVAELNRVVISLMQEIDALPNNVILIGTTNRQDMLDSALLRRFTMRHEVKPLSSEDCSTLAEKFCSDCGIKREEWESWLLLELQRLGYTKAVPASAVINVCTERLVQKIINKHETEGDALLGRTQPSTS